MPYTYLELRDPSVNGGSWPVEEAKAGILTLRSPGGATVEILPGPSSPRADVWEALQLDDLRRFMELGSGHPLVVTLRGGQVLAYPANRWPSLGVLS